MDDEVVPASGSAEQRVFCDVTAKFMPANVCNEAKAIAANARRGLGSVEYPDTIIRGETRIVSFAVRRASPNEALPADSGTVPASNQPFTLKITGRMAALLEGEGFKIEPNNLQYRDIGISDGARWTWNITALKAPHHRLTLTAYMVVEAADGSMTESAIIPSKEFEIPVKVTIPQRASDLAESFVSLSTSAKAIIGAIIAVVVLLITLRTRIAELIRTFRSGRSSEAVSR